MWLALLLVMPLEKKRPRKLKSALILGQLGNQKKKHTILVWRLTTKIALFGTNFANRSVSISCVLDSPHYLPGGTTHGYIQMPLRGNKISFSPFFPKMLTAKGSFEKSNVIKDCLTETVMKDCQPYKTSKTAYLTLSSKTASLRLSSKTIL